MRLAILVIHYGNTATTSKCLASLRDKLGGHQLILINNTSENVEELKKIIPRTIVIDNRQNLGFAHAVNQGLRRAGDLDDIAGYVLLNNDAVLSFGSFDRLAKTFLDKPSAGIVAPVLLHHKNQYDWGGTYSKWTGMVKHKNFQQKPKTVLSVDHVAGAAMLIKKEVVDKIGLFDERFFLYYEDIDYCLRARQAGFTVHINPESVVEHSVSASSNVLARTLYEWRSHLKFIFKHMPKVVYLTALIFDLIFYPLILLKSYGK